MSRFVLAILLLISTCAVVAHGYLAYQYNVPQSLITEEEAPDEKPAGKETFELSKEKIFITDYHDRILSAESTSPVADNNWCLYCKGFWDAPYNPPENFTSSAKLT
jgi:hypothetical protein